ncbi:hypothetical protein BgiMline_003877 [Biomphalaria glabrata]|nr:hypothetical protein BgiMline_012395 [Biomphalaria glabrata]
MGGRIKTKVIKSLRDCDPSGTEENGPESARDQNSNAGPRKPSDNKGGRQTTSGRGSQDEDPMILNVEEFIRQMVGNAQHRLLAPTDPNLDLEEIRRLITESQNVQPRDLSDQSTMSTELPIYESDTPDTSPRGRDAKMKKKTLRRKRFDPTHQRRPLYRPSPFLTYIKPEDYVCVPNNHNLPTYCHNALPFPWGVRLPLPKSQRNSPDLPVCSPLPLFPSENIIAFSYQHSSKHYQICADSKAEQKLEWL